MSTYLISNNISNTYLHPQAPPQYCHLPGLAPGITQLPLHPHFGPGHNFNQVTGAYSVVVFSGLIRLIMVLFSDVHLSMTKEKRGKDEGCMKRKMFQR